MDGTAIFYVGAAIGCPEKQKKTNLSVGLFGAQQGIIICKVNIILAKNNKLTNIFIDRFIDKYIDA